MAANLCRYIFRNRAIIDWTIDQTADKKPRGRIYKVLRIAVAQIIEKQLPEALVCDTMVRFCKNKFNHFEASYVNQFLRKLTSQPLPVPTPKIALCLSPEISRQWNKIFTKEQIVEWAGVLKTPPVLTARQPLNETDVSDLEPFLKPLDLPDWAAGYKFFTVEKPRDFIENNNGRIYIQDPATIAAVKMLDPQEGEVIADLCSAPGGKSRLIAEALKGTGQLFACDSSAKRLTTVEANLKDFDNVTILKNNACNSDLKARSFDAILLDVPCSNSGVIRRKPDVRWTFNRQNLKDLNELQLDILTDAVRLLKPGGRIIYSTCSIDPQENEQVVDSFLKFHPNASVVESQTLYPALTHDGSHATKIVFSDKE